MADFSPMCGALYPTGFTQAKRYLADQGGQQVAALNASGAWQHSNLFSGGKLVATCALSVLFSDTSSAY